MSYSNNSNVEYVSYRANALFAETMLLFLNGAGYGAVWGCVTPFYPPGSIEFKREVATGIFKPAPPFRALRSIPTNALFFASIFATNGLCNGAMRLIRGRDDFWNELVGMGGMFGHAYFFNTARRLKLHNRAVGSVVALGLIYTNFIA